MSVAQKPIGLRLAEAEKDPTLPVPLKGKFEPNLGQWEYYSDLLFIGL